MRLIDADKLLETGSGVRIIVSEDEHPYDAARKIGKAFEKAVKDAPTVDAVEVVRCKNCDWYRDDGSICVNPKCTKSYYGCRVPKEHYCSFGERREE